MKDTSTSPQRDFSLVSIGKPMQLVGFMFGNVTALLCLLVNESIINAVGEHYWMALMFALVSLLFTICISVFRALPRISGDLAVAPSRMMERSLAGKRNRMADRKDVGKALT